MIRIRPNHVVQVLRMLPTTLQDQLVFQIDDTRITSLSRAF